MAAARTRSNARDYPGCLTIVEKPVPGGWNKTWAELEAWVMGAGSSGHSGVVKGGIVLTSATASETNTWGEAV